MSERKSGLLLHISSLPCEFGIGDLGPSAYQFVDFLYKTKQHCWQILPINPTDSISGHSPYSSPSAFAGNTLFISPQLLVDDGLLDKKDISILPKFSSTVVHYETVTAYKTTILNQAYQRFVSDPAVSQVFETAFNDFLEANTFWLDDYALFVAIRDHCNGKGWLDWSQVLRKREKKALDDFLKSHKKEINKVKFLQFLFFKQWDRLKAYCANRDVQLLGDMPIYVNMDSADVWTYPQNYKLDDQCRPLVVAGVPPDYFSETGQRWGNPVYDWGALKASQFSWWVERFKFNFRAFDAVRIDHFRGLVQCWEIPTNEPTAVNGTWMDVPTDDFFKTLEARFSTPLPIIAEDLGYITEDVREAMRRFNFPGMKVLLFAFNGDMNEHPYLPHNFNERSIVYTGTHDNNTVLGWFEDEASDQERQNIQGYIGKAISADNVNWELIRIALDSKAELAIIPLQDVLGLGSEARMNKPATTDKNWQWRVSSDAFGNELIEKLLNMTVETNRG